LSLTSERLAQLSETKRALLEKRLRGASSGQPSRAAIVRDPRRSAAPLSFAQERIWFFEQLEPGSPMFNLPLALRIEGDLRVKLLETLFGEIVRRHEALRTVILVRDGEPMQEVRPPSRWALPIVDLSALSGEAREAAVRELVAEEAVRPFDLARGPMLRTGLLRLGAREHVMLLTLHHIASDGWSTGVLTQEVGTLYGAYFRRLPSPLPELPVQYADYSVWQREWLSGEVLEQQLGYWRTQLAGADEVLDLPVDRPRGAMSTFRGLAREVVLPPALSAQLRALMKTEGATPFMLFLAAYKVLLCRYTGREDVSVGTPIAGRNRREIEDLIGFFVNTLVLRTALHGNPTFRELLGRVRQVALDAYAHQDLPFEKLVEELRPERSLSHTPLFQVMFVLQNATGGGGPDDGISDIGGSLQGLRLEPLETGTVTAEHDWTLEVTEEGDGFQAAIQFRSDLFDGATVERALSHLEVLLRHVAARPEARLWELPLFPEPECHQLLREWSGASRAVLEVGPVEEAVTERAALSPEAPAVLGIGTLSFRQLDEESNRLACELRRAGIGPDSVVALCFERSPEMAVAILGVLKSGGAFLPLDPAHPEERLAFLLEDSGAMVVLTQDRLAPRLPIGRADIIRLDADRERIELHSAAPLESRTPPESLAYVIYTSGSTGRPKGAGISRGALAGYTAAVAAELELRPEDRVLQFASLSFDVAVEEILPTWWSGAAVVLRPADAVASPEGLLRVLSEDGVTVCNLPTSFWHEWVWFLESSASALPPSLRLLVIGGEAVLPERLAYWRGLGVPLLHGYGLTEATVTSTMYRASVHGGDPGHLLPIGRPLAGTGVFVADRELQPVPIGVPGELCVAGDGLVRGYLRRPDLTAERFVPDPWSRLAGARIYRTGDRARFLADGNLEFLGRLDFQLKIRGYRVEPGEIEVELGRHPAVREAAVLARPAADGSQRLVAYVALQADGDADGDLRRHLRQRLPDYMVPSAFVVVDALPRTPAGKVDRAALPDPAGTAEPEGPAGLRTQTEELLATLWSQVLGVETIGPRAEFFELGGHSLLGTRLMSRVRETFGVEVPLRALFEQPTLVGLAGEIDGILLSGQAARRPPVERMPRDGDLPLSFAQRRLWFIDQIEPGNAAYNMPAALRIEGDLDFDAFERTMTEILRRHEVLRTRFVAADAEPLQRIEPPKSFSVPRIDLRALDGATREEEALRLATWETQAPFDLENGPMLRVRLLLLGGADNALLFTLHHIVSDAWSLEVMVREISALYVAFSKGEASPLPELRLQYADFAAWQRQWLQGEELDTQLAWWKGQLSDVSHVLNLPTDLPRPPVQSFRGGGHLFELSPELSGALRALSRREGMTLFMTVLAAFQALLARYASQEDFCVGTPVAGRNQIETEDLIGFFINTLALRADLRGAGSFRELLRRVREVCLGAFSHQEFPLEKLVEVLHPERDLSRQPLFQVVFALEHDMGGEPVELPGLTLTPLENGGSTAKFDLTLTVTETGEGLQGGFDFCSDLFEAPTVARMAAHLETILRAMADDAATGLDVELLTPAERQQALHEWNDTWTAVDGVPVHLLVEAQADLDPGRPAVIGDGGDGGILTYGDLDRRANQLARRLLALGVGPESVVGVWIERSPDMILAQLAILKAGGAYLPLDVRHPRERVAYMLEDAGVSLVLSTGALSESFPPSAFERGVQLVLLDQGTFDGESPERLDVEVFPEGLAYVIYTSGSTGRPKGTQLTHAGLANLVRWHRREYAVGPEDRATQVASPAFDAAVWEVWPYLAAGASLHLPSEEVRSAPAALLDWLIERGITLCFLPTPLAESLLDLPPRPVPLRAMLVGGDRLRRPPRRALPFRLMNHYGPTESTVVSTWAVVPPGGDEEDASPPIGRPLDNLRVHLLDRDLRPVPVGVAGELLVGGIGLARGYLGRPDLTAERFVPDLLGGAGGRLYRTGDLGRLLADGRIEFLGRADHQVKVRGYRIELGEIEAVLLQHGAVKEAAVLVREDKPGDRRIVAYVVPTPESKFPWLRQLGPDGKILPFQPIASRRKVRARWSHSGGEVVDTWPKATPTELRAFLEERLPDYMVPGLFVTSLEALPLTPTGKVDRAALPAPTDEDAGGTRKYMAPRTVTEELLAGIFSELLGIKRVGIHDNFFELGGHSLLATLASTRIRKLFGVHRLPLRKLFENPTVAEMAAVIEQERKEQRGIAIPPIERVPQTGPMPLSFAQQRLWFLDRLQPGSTAYNIPQGMRMGGLIDVGALRASFREVVRRHEVLRTTFATSSTLADTDGSPVQIVDPEPDLALPVIDLSELPDANREAEAQRISQKELDRPFDLQAGPLLRVRLLRFAEKDHMVLLTVHHIVSDGWSMGILVREVGQLYEAFSHGKPSPLPELPVQYADYAVWQRAWLQGEVLEEQLSFWRKQLEGAPPVLDLPTDRPRPDIQTTRGALQSRELSPSVSSALKAMGPREGATLFMTLLAGFKALLSVYARRSDILVGTPSAGRNQLETEELIGFFVNTIVLRSDVSADLSARELIQRIREVVLEAYAHQDLPFERLVEEIRPERSLSHEPVFQVMMVLQNNLRQGGERLPGVKTQTVGIRRVTVQRDLTLEVQERPDTLLLSLEYNAELFDHTRMTRMLGHLEVLLQSMAEFPERRLSEAPRLTEAEAHQVVREWNDTGTEAPADGTIHDFFARQAALAPDAVAVVQGETRLTYRALAERARTVAALLRTRGIGPEVPVAICTERSPESIFGLLGILMAGGAYVPLDPGNPSERQALVLADVRPPVLLTQRRLAAALEPHGIPLLCLDDDLPGMGETEAVPAVPENLAYVIYTSGSTGRPKGVGVDHRAAVGHFTTMRRVLGLEASDRVLQFSSLAFDVSVQEILPTLLCGATLVLREETIATVPEMVEWVDRHRISVLSLPTAYWNLLAQAGTQVEAAPAPKHLRVAVVAGEAMLPEPLRVWRKSPWGAVRLINGYGPTEATVLSTTDEPRDSLPAVPIGRPLANRVNHVLDPALRPVPSGVPGELCLGGEGLARGYLGKPAETAERFVPDPLSGIPGARLYATGDLARTLADGRIEFLGRIDQQLKIRGFRVEPGEVEAALLELPGVRECAVVARDVAGVGGLRLVAYVVLEPEASVDSVREPLRKRLPDYMAPAHFEVLEALPRTATGKVDRKALPAPASEGQETGGYLAPRDEVERQIAALWEDVLGIRPVGLRDDFFHLGGHSLLAVRLLSRLESATGKRIPMAALFQGATVERLAALVRGQDMPLREASLVPIQTRGSRPPMFWVHPAGGNVLCYAPLSRALGDDFPIYGLQAQGLDGTLAPFTDIGDMATHYLGEMEAVAPEGPYYLGGWSLGGVIAFEMARQLRERGKEVKLLVMIDVRAPELEDRLAAKDPRTLLRSFALDFGLPPDFSMDEDPLGFDFNRQLGVILEKAKAEGLVAPDIELAQVSRYFEIFRANFRALSQYKPGRLRGGASLLKAAEPLQRIPQRPEAGWIERAVRRAHLALDTAWSKAWSRWLQPTLGWRPLVEKEIGTGMLPGTHYTLLRKENVEALAEWLRRALPPSGR
jgi:amino acid adenylation domain-containing protein